MNMSEVSYLTDPGTVSPVALLRKAKKLLRDPENWWRGGAGSKGRDCVVLAVAAARGSLRQQERAFNMISMTIGAPWFDLSHIYVWNDAPQRTHDEVMAMFDLAIERARRYG